LAVAFVVLVRVLGVILIQPKPLPGKISVDKDKPSTDKPSAEEILDSDLTAANTSALSTLSTTVETEDEEFFVEEWGQRQRARRASSSSSTPPKYTRPLPQSSPFDNLRSLSGDDSSRTKRCPKLKSPSKERQL